MTARNCRQMLEFPEIKFELDDASPEERKLAQRLAAEVNRITTAVGSGDRDRIDPCSFGGRLREKLDGMDEETITAIVRGARRAAGGRGTEDRDERDTRHRNIRNRNTRNRDTRNRDIRIGDQDLELNEGLLSQARELFARRVKDLRPQFSAGIKKAAEQAKEFSATMPLTTVDFRISGESTAFWTNHTQLAGPESLYFRWRTTENMAERAYYELRGPVTPGDRGKLLDRGFLNDYHDEEGVGGYFEIALNRFLPAQPPQVAERYHVKVLPLSAPSVGAVYTPFFDRVLTSIEDRGDAQPPEGVGPWSLPAIIDYGKTFTQVPSVFDIETITYYRKAKFHIDWFKVDADQSGPGAEEYHIRAFMVEINPLESKAHGNYGAYMEVEESDKSKHTLSWAAYTDLGNPFTNQWPRFFFTGMSVLEDDAGAELDEWFAAITEIFTDVLRGDFEDEIREVIQEIRQEIDEATEGFRRDLSAATVAFLVAAVGAAMLKVFVAWVIFAIALIAGFIGAGARDDFFGFHMYALSLLTNDAEKIQNGQAGAIKNSKIVAAGGVLDGEEVNGRFKVTPTEIQLFGVGTGDAGSPVDGIVRIGLSWDFYDKVTRNF